MPYQGGVDLNAPYLASSMVASYWSYAFNLIKEGLCSNAQDIHSQMELQRPLHDCETLALEFFYVSGQSRLFWAAL